MTERSVGARKFSQMPGTPEEKAKRYGVSAATISRWGNGHHNPKDPAIIARITADGGPLECEWEEQEAKLNAPPSRPPIEANAGTVQGEANRMLRMVQGAIDEAELEPDVAKRLGLLRDGTAVIAQLGKVTGAGHVVTERQILDSPHWRLMCDRIVTALEPWPDALIAVGTALEGPRA